MLVGIPLSKAFHFYFVKESVAHFRCCLFNAVFYPQAAREVLSVESDDA